MVGQQCQYITTLTVEVHMKNTNKIVLAFCVIFLLLGFVGCDESIKDNNSVSQDSSASQQSETLINAENGVRNNNNGIQTNSSPDDKIQYLPDDYVNNADSSDEIDSDDLDGNIKDVESQSSDSSQEIKPSENDEKIKYDDNSGWSSGWN